MAGRHREFSARWPGRVTAVVAAVVVIGASVAAWAGYRAVNRHACANPVRLTVTAAPELVPALRTAADGWERTRAARVDGRCVDVTVTGADPADLAAAVAARGGGQLTGLGPPSGTTVVPDVWVPDSSMWLQRLRLIRADLVPNTTPPVATSPVVLGVPEPVATGLGWPNLKLTWADLLTRARSDTTAHFGIVEPSRDAAGLAALGALDAVAGSGGDRAAAVAALRALAGGRSRIREDLLRRYPQSDDPAALASGLTFAPLSEQAIIGQQVSQPAVRIVPVRVEPAPPALDYPYVVMPGIGEAKVAAATALRASLAGTTFRDLLAENGLRAGDGSIGVAFAIRPQLEVNPAVTVPAPDGDGLDRLLSTWSAITAPARMLAVIDVSGSMLEPVPTAGGATRMAVTVEAARRGLALFDDSWAVGVWTFSTQLDGDRDYLQLQPVRPLSDQRDQLGRAIAGIVPKRDGDTGLYDTVLAAYRAVQEGWDPGRVNSVVLLTDGENDDANGPSLDQLLEQLRAAVDPKRPVQVILVGIGTSTSEASMRRITEVTGGGVFLAEDPAKIGEIFLKALALRPTPR